MAALIMVRGMPALANSRKVSVAPFFSAFWMTMTLLAAPRMKRLPAIALALVLHAPQEQSEDNCAGYGQDPEYFRQLSLQQFFPVPPGEE